MFLGCQCSVFFLLRSLRMRKLKCARFAQFSFCQMNRDNRYFLFFSNFFSRLFYTQRFFSLSRAMLCSQHGKSFCSNARAHTSRTNRFSLFFYFVLFSLARMLPPLLRFCFLRVSLSYLDALRLPKRSTLLANFRDRAPPLANWDWPELQDGSCCCRSEGESKFTHTRVPQCAENGFCRKERILAQTHANTYRPPTEGSAPMPQVEQHTPVSSWAGRSERSACVARSAPIAISLAPDFFVWRTIFYFASSKMPCDFFFSLASHIDIWKKSRERKNKKDGKWFRYLSDSLSGVFPSRFTCGTFSHRIGTSLAGFE